MCLYINLFYYNIKIIILLLLLYSCFSIKIGYIRKDGENSADVTYINNYIQILNQNNADITIELIEMVYGKADDSDYVTQISDKDLTIAIAVCHESIDDEMKGYINGNGTVLWCADLFAGYECNANVINGINVIPSLEQSIIF